MLCQLSFHLCPLSALPLPLSSFGNLYNILPLASLNSKYTDCSFHKIYQLYYSKNDEAIYYNHNKIFSFRMMQFYIKMFYSFLAGNFLTVKEATKFNPYNSVSAWLPLFHKLQNELILLHFSYYKADAKIIYNVITVIRGVTLYNSQPAGFGQLLLNIVNVRLR